MCEEGELCREEGVIRKERMVLCLGRWMHSGWKGKEKSGRGWAASCSFCVGCMQRKMQEDGWLRMNLQS